jgi:NAD dependent epimerase/dehydratase
VRLADARRILVTGSDGFIGSHLVEALARRGHSVRAFVYYNSFNSWGWLDSFEDALLKRIEVFPGDIRDSACVRAAVRDCDAVFHLAALIAIPYSYRSPESYVETNVKGTLNILQAARDFATRKIVVTSTSEVYGTAQRVPIDEDHPLQAQSPYAATKIAADQLALSFHRAFDTPVSVLRPFNTYGPRQSLRAVIPTIIAQLAAGHEELHLGSLDPTRDLTFVEDTASAFIAVMEADGSVGRVLNAGTGRETSIGELAQTIAQVMKRPMRIVQDAERLRPDRSEVFRLIADWRNLEKVGGWRPTHTLEDGLAKTIAWFTQPENLSHYRKANLYTY